MIVDLTLSAPYRIRYKNVSQFESTQSKYSVCSFQKCDPFRDWGTESLRYLGLKTGLRLHLVKLLPAVVQRLAFTKNALRDWGTESLSHLGLKTVLKLHFLTTLVLQVFPADFARGLQALFFGL